MLTPVFFPGQHAVGQNPGNVSSILWLRADMNTSTTTDGATLSGWTDLSASADNATQGTGALMPVFYNDATNNINFNPVISFNGTTFLNLNANGLADKKKPRTVMIVAAPSAVSTTQYVISWGSNTQDQGFSVGAANSTGVVSGVTDDVNTAAGFWKAGYPEQFTGWWAGNMLNVQLYGNGLMNGGPTAENYKTMLGNATIGEAAWGGNNWNGTVAEVIVFNAALTAANLQSVGSYLAIKYGYTLDQTTATNYVSTTGTTTWNATALATYAHNITGIGRDNNESLNQRQSRNTAPGFQVTLALGNAIAATNTANPSTIPNDTSYLMWGDDGGATTYTRPVSVAGTTYNAMVKTWVANKSNWSDQNVTITQDSGSTSQYLLVSSAANFSSGVTVYAMSSGTKTLNSSLIPNGYFFTFATIIPLPVNLVSFTGAATKEGNELSWITAGEQHNAYFAIERSTDGRVFDSIGVTPGKGSTSLEENYSFLDPLPVPNTTNYYRLHQVDDNGWYTDSRVIALRDDGGPVKYSAYPIPARTTVHLAIPSQFDQLGVNVYAADGRLAQALVLHQPGSGADLDVSALAPGMYFMVIIQPDGIKKNLAFMKQ